MNKDLEDLKKQIVEIIDEKIEHEHFCKPKMVNYVFDGYADGNPVYDAAWCPGCGRVFDVDDEHYNFCPECGQRLKWEED